MNITSILNWFKQAVPNPTGKNRAVQLGVHQEENAEMLKALGFTKEAVRVDVFADYLKMEDFGAFDGVDRLELLDAMCDQIVTAVGVAHMFGLDITGALAEVDRSNWSKFVDGKPAFNEHGKISKPPTYSPPDLRGFV